MEKDPRDIHPYSLRSRRNNNSNNRTPSASIVPLEKNKKSSSSSSKSKTRHNNKLENDRKAKESSELQQKVKLPHNDRYEKKHTRDKSAYRKDEDREVNNNNNSFNVELHNSKKSDASTSRINKIHTQVPKKYTLRGRSKPVAFTQSLQNHTSTLTGSSTAKALQTESNQLQQHRERSPVGANRTPGKLVELDASSSSSSSSSPTPTGMNLSTHESTSELTETPRTTRSGRVLKRISRKGLNPKRIVNSTRTQIEFNHFEKMRRFSITRRHRWRDSLARYNQE